MIVASQLRAALAPDVRPWPVRVAWAALAVLVVVAVVAPLGGYDPVADVVPAQASLPPGAGRWLGTDHLGRDTAWRLAWATRAFVAPGLLCALVTIGVGVPLGALAGGSGDVVAGVVRWVTSVISAVPSIVLALLAAAIFGADTWILAVALGVAGAPGVAEAVAGRLADARATVYVLAMRGHGVGGARLLWIHLVLGLGGRAIARAALLAFGSFLAIEATLSYLGGFGVREPWPSWGNMLAFEWGRTGLVPTVAPALALWGALVAVHAAADAFAEPVDG